MAREWLGTEAYFWELGDLPSGSPVSVGGENHLETVVPNSPQWNRLLSAIGDGRASFYATGYWNDWIQPGRVCVIVQRVNGYAELSFGRLLACFIINDIVPHSAGGINYVDVSGPGVEALLSKVPVWQPVGEEELHEAVLTVAIPAPWSTTAAAELPGGVDFIHAVDNEGVDEGDEVRVEMDTGGTYIGRVTSVNPPAAEEGVCQVDPRVPNMVSAGNDIEFRKTKLKLDDNTHMAPDQRAELTLNGGATFTSVIIDAGTGGNGITLRDGVPAAANIGNAVTVYDYSARTSSDVTQVMQHAGDWTVLFESGNGSAEGTAHVPQGESVFDILNTIAERTGEFFRYHIPASTVPTLTLQWRRTPDASGVTLIMYGPDEYARQLSHETNIGVGAAIHLSQRISTALVNRIYPSAGDQVISLSQCSADALAYAAAAGCVINISDDFYEPDSVSFDPGLILFDGPLAIRETYGDIALTDAANLAEVQAASDQLLLSAVQSLTENHWRHYFTIEAYAPAVIKPGQTVKIDNATRVIPQASPTANYIVLEVTEMQVDGRPRTRLVVSDNIGLRRTAANTFALQTRGLIQSVRRLGTRGAGGAKQQTVIIDGGGGATDHGALTGLTDDDHSQYLLTNGGRTLTGNLAVAPGVTIDGVDISALAAGGAGHSPVTAYNHGIRVEGDQQVGVKLTSLPSGLGIRSAAGVEGLTVLLNPTASGMELTVSGLALADAVAGEGLKMVNKTLHVDRAANSGLLITGDQLALGPPGSLTAVTTNAVTGASHSHAVSASANPGPATQLLKTDPSGYLQLFSLGIGTTPDGASGLKVMSPQPTWYGLFLKQRTGQTAQMLRIEDTAGAALLLVTNDGNLESGNPGFVSGLTGWQIAPNGDAEFNNVRVRGELHATTFVADEMHATGGTLQIATASNVAEPTATYRNELASLSSATTYLVVNGSWASGLNYFPVKDVIRIKSMGPSAGGSLYIPDIYLEVAAVINLNDRNLSQGNPGRYVLQCLRKSGGYTGYKVPTGAAVVKWTYTGGAAGAYKGNMLLTADLAQSPYLDVLTVDASLAALSPWPGSGDLRTPPTIKPRVRLGNLDGVLGLTEQWGIAAGTDLSDTSTAAKYLVASELGVTLRNVDLLMYAGANRVLYLSPSGIEIRNSEDTFVFERTIRWQRPNGALVGAIAAMGDGTYSRFELGADPVFGHDLMVENGVAVFHDKAKAYGDFAHSARLLSWGQVILAGGHSVLLSGPYTAISGDGRVAGGLVVGDTAADPDNGVLMIKERATAAFSAAGFAKIWIQDVGGVQKLYVKFDNGVQRELASG